MKRKARLDSNLESSFQFTFCVDTVEMCRHEQNELLEIQFSVSVDINLRSKLDMANRSIYTCR